MKKTAAALLLGLAHLSSFALSEIHSLSAQEQKAIEQMSASLGLGESDALTVYKTVFQPHMKEKDWVYKFYDTETLAKSQVSATQHKFMHLSLVNEDRFVNYSLTRFEGTSQVMVYVVESLPRTSQVASKRNGEMRANKQFEIVGEQKNFSLFKEKGKANVVSFFASNGWGGIQYADHYFVTIKGE